MKQFLKAYNERLRKAFHESCKRKNTIVTRNGDLR